MHIYEIADTPMNVRCLSGITCK